VTQGKTLNETIRNLNSFGFITYILKEVVILNSGESIMMVILGFRLLEGVAINSSVFIPDR